MVKQRGSTRCFRLRSVQEGFTQAPRAATTSDGVALHRAVRLAVEEELQAAADKMPGFSTQLPEHLTVNGAGAFEVVGPEGDNGLSGKKRVVDADGPRLPIDESQLVSHFDLRLLRSGTSLPVEDFVDVARWGHFANADFPWKQIKAF